MLPTKFRFIWPSGFRGEDFKKSANQKQELPVAAMFVNESGRKSNIYRGPSIDASYQVSVHLAEGFQRKRLKCEKLTDYRRRMPSDGKSSLCLWQGELNKRRSNRADSKFNLTYNSANSVLWVRVRVFNASFNNISVILWWSVLLMEETGLPGENHRPVASHWQTLS